MKVTVDPDSGFCFGVNNAIHTAEAELEAGRSLYSLGELVHNNVQMDVLKAKGLQVISHDDLPLMSGKTVLLRAHGEPPETYQLAEKHGVTLIDATCPIVEKLQQRVKSTSNERQQHELQIVLYGKPGHAEMIGLEGNTDNKSIVVTSESDLAKIDFTKPVRVFSQTTMDAEGYLKITDAIAHRMSEAGNNDLVVNKSVCRQVSNRAPSLRSLAAANDVVIFIAGQNSSNGAYLYSVCKLVNPKTYFISKVDEIQAVWFESAENVVVTGATSTPGWLITEAAATIQNFSGCSSNHS